MGAGRLRGWALALAALTLVGGLGGCSRQVEIADPLDPVVMTEIQRIKDLAGSSTDPAWPAAECDIVIYRIDDDSTYGWQYCQTRESGGSWSAPFAVRGTEMWHPRDGSEYGPSIEARFPSDLARAVLADELPRVP